jgi:hypothetical protein
MKVATILVCVFVLGGGQSDAFGWDTIVGALNKTFKTTGDGQKNENVWFVN